MWNYERRLQYPVNITKPNAKIAQIIISQYGGPDGEAAASFRYLSQRFSMPYRKVAGLLTDIGTEELGCICCILIFFHCKRVGTNFLHRLFPYYIILHMLFHPLRPQDNSHYGPESYFYQLFQCPFNFSHKKCQVL